MKAQPIVIAIDGTSASGKSTAARLAAKTLDYIYVDTGAMYRSLAWYCVKNRIDPQDAAAVARACRTWKTNLICEEKPARHIRLVINDCFPEKEIRTQEITAAASHVAAVPKVREWMKRKQRECIQFGNLVMEGRDIGTNVFPETDFKFYLDASLSERARRRDAEGVHDNLAARDARDSQRAAAPLMIALGAVLIDTSGQTPEQTNHLIITEFHRRLDDRRQLNRRS
ncbi:MAG TPA: (d)CMP kinase [Candidatus Saccharimonadales bacterium]|nr:(d)CMP kinase [Candidatus Saccharimonadales bacterium]